MIGFTILGAMLFAVIVIFGAWHIINLLKGVKDDGKQR